MTGYSTGTVSLIKTGKMHEYRAERRARAACSQGAGNCQSCGKSSAAMAAAKERAARNASRSGSQGRANRLR